MTREDLPMPPPFLYVDNSSFFRRKDLVTVVTRLPVARQGRGFLIPIVIPLLLFSMFILRVQMWCVFCYFTFVLMYPHVLVSFYEPVSIYAL